MSVNIFGFRTKNTPSLDSSVNSKFITLLKQLSRRVDKSGDSMSGQLNMGGHKITEVADPVLDNDAGNKKYTQSSIKEESIITKLYIDAHLDTKLTKSGGILTGILDMNNNSIIGVRDPVIEDEACNKKYVDLSLRADSTRIKSYIDTMINRIQVKSKIGYIPVLTSNLDSKYGFKVTSSSENENESKHAFNVFTYKRSEWITNNINRDFWIQIQCPEAVKVYRFALRGKSSGRDCIVKWRLQGKISNVDMTWTDLYVAENDPITLVVRYFYINPSAEYINYRIFVHEAEGANPGLSYWQLYIVDNVVPV